MKTFAQIFALAILEFAFNASAQQIHIKARFFEVPKQTFASLQKDFEVASDGTQILTPEQLATTLSNLKNSECVDLAEPEVITTGGRQTQMRATQIQTIPILLAESSNNSVIAPQTEQVEFGPVLDVIPKVLSDGQIELAVTASDKKFFGSADPKNSPASFATNSAGEKVNLPTILPVIQLNKASAQVAVPDGATLVLFPKAEVEQDQRLAQHIAQAEKKSGKKYLVVFVTPTLVDASGNRIHSDN